MKKRIKKIDKSNKVTSTQEKVQERRMSITIMDNPQTDKTNNNEEKKVENIIERSESEENLSKAIQETENLKIKLKVKKEESENNKIKDENELLIINNNIKDKSEKLENISNNNKILINKLNYLNNQVNEEYNKVKVLKVSNKIKINYKNELKIKEKKRSGQGKKVILINNQIIDKYKIQKEKLEKIIKEDKNLKINEYKKKLEDLNKKKNDLIQGIEGLKLIKNNHEKNCIKLNVDLNKTLERLKNEYNDEYKSKNDFNKILENKRNNSVSNASMNSLPKIINGNNFTSPANIINESENIKNSNKIRLKKNTKSLSNLFWEEDILQKDLKELKEQFRKDIKSKINQKIKRYITTFSIEKKKNSIKEIKNNGKKNLFSKLEKEMLSKIIPNECLEIYQDKFRTIEDERFHIEKQINKNESKKKVNEEKYQLLFINEKKENNMIKKNIELNAKISMIKKNINSIIKKLKIIQNEFNFINDKYNKKKEENDKLKSHWIGFNNDIKNKKITIKKGEIIKKNELDDLNKWGNNNKKINDEEIFDDNNSIKNKIKRKSVSKI